MFATRKRYHVMLWCSQSFSFDSLKLLRIKVRTKWTRKSIQKAFLSARCANSLFMRSFYCFDFISFFFTFAKVLFCDFCSHWFPQLPDCAGIDGNIDVEIALALLSDFVTDYWLWMYGLPKYAQNTHIKWTKFFGFSRKEHFLCSLLCAAFVCLCTLNTLHMN